MKTLAELRAAIDVRTEHSDLTQDEIDAIIELFRDLIRDGNLMSSAELRGRLNLKSSAANMRVFRGSARMPPPLAKLARGWLWFRPDVEEWITANPGAVVHDVPVGRTS